MFVFSINTILSVNIVFIKLNISIYENIFVSLLSYLFLEKKLISKKNEIKGAHTETYKFIYILPPTIQLEYSILYIKNQ